MTVSKEDMKPLVEMLDAFLVENEQAQEKLRLEYLALTDKMNQLNDMKNETRHLRDAFYRYAKFITPETQVNNDN